MSSDLRDEIFASLGERQFTAEVRVCTPGLVCGIDTARGKIEALGCRVLTTVADGAAARAGEVILSFRGGAKAVAMAEDCVPGAISKPSGIARAARRAVELASGRLRIVSGAGKKMPDEIKTLVRAAVHCGGGAGRIVEGPFLYLDKNYVRMFGGVRAALEATAHMQGFARVIQLRGALEDIASEARAALALNAEVLMVDTGRIEDLDLVSSLVRRSGRRPATAMAFAGDLTLEDIPRLTGHDVDILDIGRAIIDAPMVDLKLDVVTGTAVYTGQTSSVPDSTGKPGLELNLLEKTEIRIDGIALEGTNLSELASVAASVLELPQDKVLVIDVRPNQVALDILMRVVRAEQIFGKKRALLTALASVPGVVLKPDADIHSSGILMAIGLDEDRVPATIEASRTMGAAILKSRRARVRVYPTGFELLEGRIEDTNTPYLIKVFSEAGYLADAGPAVPDNRERLVEALRAGAADCGVVVTTGGVGAEDKDFSVEAVEELDPAAAVTYLAHFARGEGRHVKDGVRLAVGELEGCMLVTLPGPNDEVRMAAPVLIHGLKQGLPKQVLAGNLALCLRRKLLSTDDARFVHAHGFGRHAS